MSERSGTDDAVDKAAHAGREVATGSKSFGVAALIVSILEAVLFFGSTILIGVNFGLLVSALTKATKSGSEDAGQAVAAAGTWAVVMVLAFVVGVILIGSALTLAIQAIGTGKGRKLGVVSLIIAISPFIVPGIAVAVIGH
ncbi:hypothetical protein [Microlunatus soli]|nr:hypothetical protein [Microlunatus soli]